MKKLVDSNRPLQRLRLWWRRRHLKPTKETPNCSRCHTVLASWDEPCPSCELDRREAGLVGLSFDDEILPIGGGDSEPTWETRARRGEPDRRGPAEDLSGLFSGVVEPDHEETYTMIEPEPGTFVKQPITDTTPHVDRR